MREVLSRPVRTVFLAAAAGLAVAAGGAPAHAAEPWGFEQVTPVSKGGGDVSSGIDAFRTSLDGSRLLYTATGSFAGLPAESSPMSVRYVGHRIDGAWMSVPVDPPFDAIPPAHQNALMITVGSSENMAYVMVASTRALTPGATEGGGNFYLRNTRTGAYTLVATNPDNTLVLNAVSPSGSGRTRFVAPDGKGAMFTSPLRLTADAPSGEQAVLYAWTPSKGLYVASVLPDDEGGAVVGGDSGEVEQGGIRRPIPGRGDTLDRVYFHAMTGGSAAGQGAYLREGDETLAISRSEVSGLVEPARVVAYSDGGDYALIRTEQGGAPLTSDTPAQPDGADGAPSYLYRYSRASNDLEYVATYNLSWLGGFGTVLQMSGDGRTIAFESSYELAPGAAPGESNIYVWRDGDLRLLTTGTTYGLENLHRTSENGRYLAFTSRSPGPFAGRDMGEPICLLDSWGNRGQCPEVFVYDSETDELSCASCRPEGVTQRGGSGDPDYLYPGEILMDQYQPRNVSNDGTVWFGSANDLLPAQDANGLTDVYAYRDGELRLVSRGRQGMSSRFADADADGSTVFISTDDPIGPADHDQLRDIYATGPSIPARTSVSEPPPPSCSGSDCRTVSTPPVSPAIGSVGFLGDGNVPSRAGGASVRVSKLKAVSGSAARLRVRVPGAGRISVAGASIRRADRAASKAGTYSVKVALSPRAKKSLRQRKSLKVSVRVSYRTRDGRAASKTVKVTFKQPQAKRAATKRGGR
jgi:hypothetical protein